MLPRVSVQRSLLISPDKCASLRNDVAGRAKRWIISTSSFRVLEDTQIKKTDIVETYKYLGLEVAPKGPQEGKEGIGSFLRENWTG